MKKPRFSESGMWVSLNAGIAGGGPKTKAPAGAAGRGLAFDY